MQQNSLIKCLCNCSRWSSLNPSSHPQDVRDTGTEQRKQLFLGRGLQLGVSSQNISSSRGIIPPHYLRVCSALLPSPSERVRQGGAFMPSSSRQTHANTVPVTLRDQNASLPSSVTLCSFVLWDKTLFLFPEENSSITLMLMLSALCVVCMLVRDSDNLLQ